MLWTVSGIQPGALRAEEGQYPINMLQRAGLKQAGLDIPLRDIFNPGATSLINGVVRIGGCTGSFVSREGLILTNHHCMFGSLKQFATPENDYLNQGFLAKNQDEELPVPGLTIKILQSYRDVSEEMREAINEIDNLREQEAALEKKKAAILKKERQRHPDLTIEMSDMLVRRSYVVFRYQEYEDVRIVHVPPKSMGAFGGNVDNWEWPRHSGDFSFVRAYSAPDGSPAAYQPENIPLKPAKILEVNPEGLSEGDFSFILGYPGRTYRNQAAGFIRYQESFFMPYIQQLFEWEIEKLEAFSEIDPALEIKYATRIARLGNTEKNFRGKLKALDRIELYEQRRDRDERLMEQINNNQEWSERFGDVIPRLRNFYGVKCSITQKYYWRRLLLSYAPEAQLAHYAVRAAQDPDRFQNDTAFRKGIMKVMRSAYRSGDYRRDSLFLAKMFRDTRTYLDGLSWLPTMPHFGERVDAGEVRPFVLKVYGSDIMDSSAFLPAFQKDPARAVAKKGGPLAALFMRSEEAFSDVDALWDEVNSQIDLFTAQYADLRRAVQGKQFIPDANGTLRLTYGYVKGYSPSDATYYRPFTTLEGILYKMNTGGVYKTHPPLKSAIRNYQPGPYFNERVQSVPVNLLYNMDTTGGNSGSPVLDSKGRLVGLNFDRTFEATVNDFQWNESYSRSIGVDIRYILWALDHVVEGDYLLQEMGVQDA